jgi:uncharacterized phage protein (TIGR01671 family)
MREIKFRAWDENSQTWAYFTIGQQMNNSAKEIYSNVCINGGDWFQYTGLKDKNGVEIYEDDIIRSETYRVKISDNTRVIGSEHTNDYIIEWSTKPFIDGWQLRKIDTSEISKFGIGNIFNTSLHVYIKSCEVIGNIHENPDLL